MNPSETGPTGSIFTVTVKEGTAGKVPHVLGQEQDGHFSSEKPEDSSVPFHYVSAVKALVRELVSNWKIIFFV